MKSLVRARGDDILILSRHFLNQHTQRLGRPMLDLSPSAQRALLAYEWSGNVRELNNEMERLAALTIGSEIVETDLSAKIRATAADASTAPPAAFRAAARPRDETPLPRLPEADAESGEGAIAQIERLAVIKALAQKQRQQDPRRQNPRHLPRRTAQEIEKNGDRLAVRRTW
jgi:DNA-binding NtrC family response regulator